MVQGSVALLAPAIVIAGVGFLARKGCRKLKKPSAPSRVAQDFQPVPQLSDGKTQICDLQLCRVYLVLDQNYPCWVVLVPKINGIKEVTELTDIEQELLWKEVAKVSSAVQALYHPDKMNIAAIGNVVSQLHVHVTARLTSDPSWPGPCYGAVPHKSMEQFEVQQAVFTLRKALSA